MHAAPKATKERKEEGPGEATHSTLRECQQQCRRVWVLGTRERCQGEQGGSEPQYSLHVGSLLAAGAGTVMSWVRETEAVDPGLHARNKGTEGGERQD